VCDRRSTVFIIHFVLVCPCLTRIVFLNFKSYLENPVLTELAEDSVMFSAASFLSSVVRGIYCCLEATFFSVESVKAVLSLKFSVF